MSSNTIQELFSLGGRVALITGGAGFLGRQHASALAEAGAKVVLWDISEEMLAKARAELDPKFPGRIFTRTMDIADPKSVLEAAKHLESEQGALDILVNNAGMTVARGQEKFRRYFDAFEDYPLDLWEMALQVNLTGTFLVTQSVCRLMKKSAGRASIINIASDVGVISPDHRIYQPNPERDYPGVGFNSPLSYAVSKSAIIHMTRYWATYWSKAGIRVNAISPAGIENSQDPKFQRELTERIPLGRMGRPHELKGALVYLASDASSFVTGSNLMVDGGRTIW